MTTPAIAAPATAVPSVAGAAVPATPADLFAGLLTTLTGTTVAAGPTGRAGATVPGPVPAPAPAATTEPAAVLDPAALTAAALATATVPPLLLPEAAPATATTTTTAVEAAPATTAPGHLKAACAPAKVLAPGHLKAAGAKEAPSGQHVDDVVTSTPTAAPAPAVNAPAPVPTPVAAAEPTHTVRPAIAAAAKRLSHQGDRTSLVVRLDPPELGAVLVRLTVREGQVEVTLRAPDLAAQGGLLTQAPEIQQVLKDAGLDLRSFDVSYGELAQGQSEERRETPDRGTPRQRGSADGAVHVTDDVTDPQPAGTWL